MSEKLRNWVELLCSIIAVCAGVAGLIGAWVIIPYRVDGIEKRQAALEVSAKSDHDILVRIEERVIRLQIELVKPK